MKFHWKVLLWMVLGIACGLGIQAWTAVRPYTGVSWGAPAEGQSGLVVSGLAGPAGSSKLAAGDRVLALVVDRGRKDERRTPLARVEDFEAVEAGLANGEMLWFERARGEPAFVPVGLHPDSQRLTWTAPLDLIANLFLALLSMLIVPLVMTSIITGVAGVGSGRDLGRLGAKTFTYYVSTSLLAIFVGQVLVTLVRPGDGAQLGLSPVLGESLATDVSVFQMIQDMVPTNLFDAMTSNRAMLKMIFFSLLFGFFLTRAPEPHGTRVREMFESLLAVIMKLAEGVLALIPYGVFALLARVVANTGFAVFKPLLLYMLVVFVALVVHACVTLPLVLRVVGKVSPLRWAKAMSPALVTAFSTSSSSMTLPVTLETVEHRGRVSNKVTSFTLPLGATVNMDGTALYECIGVIFLAQYYSSVNPDYTLTMGDQALVVVMALLASVGAAGIPSAGLVMMLTILSALRLPLEGAALLLAVDRPLDMLRTVVNVWSDSCGAAVVASSEGETGPREAGEALVAGLGGSGPPGAEGG